MFTFAKGTDAAAADRLAGGPESDRPRSGGGRRRVLRARRGRGDRADADAVARRRGYSARRARRRAATPIARAAGPASCPDECKGGTMMIPLDGQGSLAGWPNRLLARMDAAGGRVIMVAAWRASAAIRPKTLGPRPARAVRRGARQLQRHDLDRRPVEHGPRAVPRADNRSRAEQDAGEAAVKARRAARQ